MKFHAYTLGLTAASFSPEIANQARWGIANNSRKDVRFYQCFPRRFGYHSWPSVAVCRERSLTFAQLAPSFHQYSSTAEVSYHSPQSFNVLISHCEAFIVLRRFNYQSIICLHSPSREVLRLIFAGCSLICAWDSRPESNTVSLAASATLSFCFI